jgi:hypothetical protein
MPSTSSLLLLLPFPIIIILAALSVVGHSIQEVHAQTSSTTTNNGTGWTWLWREPPATASTSGFYVLIKWIDCVVPEDANTDETVVKIFGDRYQQWGPLSMSQGESRAIDKETAFNNAPHDVVIEVWDYDAGSWWDEHDRLGVEHISPMVTNGNVARFFDGDGAFYTVIFEVVAR